MNRKQKAMLRQRCLKKKVLQRARALLKEVEETYSEDPLWAEQWMEMAQVCLTAARLALEQSEIAKSWNHEE